MVDERELTKSVLFALVVWLCLRSTQVTLGTGCSSLSTSINAGLGFQPEMLDFVTLPLSTLRFFFVEAQVCTKRCSRLYPAFSDGGGRPAGRELAFPRSALRVTTMTLSPRLIMPEWFWLPSLRALLLVRSRSQMFLIQQHMEQQHRGVGLPRQGSRLR